jgi:hypothetical protein
MEHPFPWLERFGIAALAFPSFSWPQICWLHRSEPLPPLTAFGAIWMPQAPRLTNPRIAAALSHLSA